MRRDESEMIVAVPAAHGQRLVAKFHFGDRRFGKRPVIAWDDEGYALIADMRAGRLVRAADDPVFVGLEPAPGPTSGRPRPQQDEPEGDAE